MKSNREGTSMELTLQNITMNYKDKKALNDVSITFKPGIYGLLGPNGAGKTSLMRILATVLRQSAGEIFFNGENIKNLKERYLEQLGYQPQKFGYYPYFTGEEFIDYIGAVKGLTEKETKERMDELFEVFDLTEVRKKKIRTYSGGMKQRLNLIQAMMNNPSIVILDEPTAGLDPKQRINFKNYLSKISKAKIILLSTHITSDIQSIANKIVFLKNGEIIAETEENELLEKFKGRIFEYDCTEEEAEKVSDGLIGISRFGGKIRVRVVSDKKPTENATPEFPLLEDIYLYYYPETVDKGED